MGYFDNFFPKFDKKVLVVILNLSSIVFSSCQIPMDYEYFDNEALTNFKSLKGINMTFRIFMFTGTGCRYAP